MVIKEKGERKKDKNLLKQQYMKKLSNIRKSKNGNLNEQYKCMIHFVFQWMWINDQKLF